MNPVSDKLPRNVRSHLRTFAFLLGNGSLCDEVLDEIDYLPAIMKEGSELEQVFAIWANVIEVGPDGKVTNTSQADRRVAQWIRRYCDPEYVVDPPFEPWEVELH